VKWRRQYSRIGKERRRMGKVKWEQRDEETRRRGDGEIGE
jgi:hypothetical protein